MGIRYAAYDYDENCFLTTATFTKRESAQEYTDQVDNGIVLKIDVLGDVEDPFWSEVDDDDEDDELEDDEDFEEEDVAEDEGDW